MTLTSTTLVEKILVGITIFVVSGREPKDIIISKGVTSLTVGEGTIGNYNLKGIITSLTVGEANILKGNYHLTRRWRGDHKRLSPHAHAGEENI